MPTGKFTQVKNHAFVKHGEDFKHQKNPQRHMKPHRRDGHHVWERCDNLQANVWGRLIVWKTGTSTLLLKLQNNSVQLKHYNVHKRFDTQFCTCNSVRGITRVIMWVFKMGYLRFPLCLFI